MILFKTVKNDYINTWDKYHLTSSFRDGARWNLPGTPVIYLSSNVQNAMLEIANYVPDPRMVNAHYSVVIFEVPELSIHTIEPKELPTDWDSDSHQLSTQILGTQYLSDPEYGSILVPSATINSQIAAHRVNSIRVCVYANVVLNPEVIGLTNIQVREVIAPVYSSRMFKPKSKP